MTVDGAVAGSSLGPELLSPDGAVRRAPQASLPSEGPARPGIMQRWGPNICCQSQAQGKL
eukprot:11947213-Alexandrium_andersonii.AAC.1